MVLQKKIAPLRSRGIDLFRPEILLLILWTVVNTFFLIRRGIFMEGESIKYIQEARLFLNTGRLSTPNFWLYFVQIALLALCIRLKIGFALAVIVQLLFNLTATFYFYKTIIHILKDKRIALAGTLLLLLNFPYQEFNTFLQTESLFYSFTLIASCYLFHIDKPSLKQLLTMILLLIVICFTRPTGVLFLPPAFLYLFLIFFRKMSLAKKTALLAAIGIGFFFILDKAMGSGGELDFMLPFRDERIICGVPTLPGFLPIKTTGNGNSIYGLLYYIVHNPVQFIRMAGLRSLAFFGLYRSYFGLGHNLYLIVFFWSLHAMVLSALIYWVKEQPVIFCYGLSIILLTWLTVILTCDDWHNRFYLSISPFVILLGLPFFSKILKKNSDAHT